MNIISPKQPDSFQALSDRQAQAPAFLSDHSIGALIADGLLKSVSGESLAIEPASVDLRPIGTQSHLAAAFLPLKHQGLRDEILRLKKATAPLSHPIRPTDPYTTVVRLDIDLDLPKNVRGIFSPKSSIGRLDMHVRVLVDGHPAFDETPFGYKGPVYAEIRSSSFSVAIAAADELLGNPITQLRIERKAETVGDANPASSLLRTQHLTAGFDEHFAGYSPRPAARDHIINLATDKDLPTDLFWERIAFSGPLRRDVILPRNTFFIFASREPLRIRTDECAILKTIETSLGECRIHAAGFADPGFGNPVPTRLVFEVRNYSHDFLLKEGQPLGVLEYHRLDEAPRRGYGAGRTSYQGQGIKLSRIFI